MEIHKPKAAHSWREFLIEIGTIICGILIALSLEQGIEALHWRHQVQEAEATMQAEVRQNLVFAYERIAIQSCLTARITAIVGDLREESPAWRGIAEPTQGKYALPNVYPRFGEP